MSVAADMWRSWRVYILTVLAALVLYLLLWLSWGGGTVFLSKLATLSPNEMGIYTRLMASNRFEEPLFFEDSPTMVYEKVSERFDAAVKLTYVEVEAMCHLALHIEVRPLTPEISYETSCSVSSLGYLRSMYSYRTNEGEATLYGPGNMEQRYPISSFASYNITANQETIDKFWFMNQEIGFNALCSGFSIGTNLLSIYSPELTSEATRSHLALWLNSSLHVRITYSDGGLQRVSEYIPCQVDIDDASYEWLLQAGVPLVPRSAEATGAIVLDSEHMGSQQK